LVFPLAIRLLVTSFTDEQLEPSPDFIVENFDWEELCMLALDLHITTPSNDVVFLDGCLSSLSVLLPDSTTSITVDPILTPKLIQYVVEDEEPQSTCADIAADDSLDDVDDFRNDGPNFSVHPREAESTPAESSDAEIPQDFCEFTFAIDEISTEERTTISEPNTPRRHTLELIPEIPLERKSVSEPSHSPRFTDLPLPEDETSSEETEDSDDLASVEFNVDMKIRTVENFMYTLDYVQELVTSAPPPISSNPPCGKPYVWVQPTTPPRFQQWHSWTTVQ
jgi:hypothetical protein